MPEYDGGERFDLRLPYVDNGWVDEDADMMKQIGRWVEGGTYWGGVGCIMLHASAMQKQSHSNK